MNFKWNLFDFTLTDCQLLGKALKATPTLLVFRLRESKVGNERGRMLISHLLDHPSLRTLGMFTCYLSRHGHSSTTTAFPLDLSHNCLGDGAGRALGKMLNDHSPNLTILDVTNNRLDEVAGMSIGHALQRNSILQELNLSLNRLGDEGAQQVFKGLMHNKTLVVLNISSNDIGELSAPILAEVSSADQDTCLTLCTCPHADADAQCDPDKVVCDVQQVW
jgi:Ran GTPase-activating protein (RanGAP) involved in mRNA processing and transport